jgi:hypothetical protein
MRNLIGVIGALSLLSTLPTLAEAQASTVSFSGSVANLCVLSVTTPGTLGISATGTSLSSEETGGLSATMTVAATGTNPTVSFGAPSLTGPSGSIGNAVKQISYSSPGGANQAYTPSASNYVMNRLLDTITIKGKATNSDGFVSGNYGLQSTVTCQQ